METQEQIQEDPKSKPKYVVKKFDTDNNNINLNDENF